MRLLTAVVEAVTGSRRTAAQAADAPDQPAAGECIDGDPGLATVLRAAAAPPSLRELAGEELAVAAFMAARAADASSVPGSSPPLSPPVGPRRPGSHRRRGVGWAIVVTVAVAMILSGGAVYAASTGGMPERLRQYAHDLFDPSAGGTTAPPRNAPSADVRPTSTAVPSITSDQDGLCQAWRAAQETNRSMGAGGERKLTELAGGADRIAAFCATMPSAQPSSPGHNTKPAPTKAAPAKNRPINAAPTKVARRARTRTGQAS